MKRTIDPSTIAWVTTIINWRYSTDQVQLLQHEAHVLFGVTDNRGRMVGCQMRVLEEPQRLGYGGRVESASITAYAHATRDGIDWVIVGGESAPRARPCDVAWIRSIVWQCRAAGVPVRIEQLGAHSIANNIYDLGPAALRRWDSEHAGEPFPKGGVRVCLRDRKGGDPSEWPADLRVREWPAPVQEEQPK